MLKNPLVKMQVVVVVLLAGALFAFNTYSVQPDEEAVVVRFGKVHHVAQPGLRMKIPFIDDVHLIPVGRAQHTVFDRPGASGSQPEYRWKIVDAKAYFLGGQRAAVELALKDTSGKPPTEIDAALKELGAKLVANDK